MNTNIRTVLPGLLVAAAAAAASAPLAAAEYWLQAQETTRTVATAAGPEAITMWEYASCDNGFAACVASAPGPLLRVPAGEGLTIHLRNGLARAGNGILLSHVDAYGGLPVPTSLQVAGLPAPTFDDNPAAVVTFGNGAAARIRSFTSEVANGATGTYRWTAAQLRPGSYVYQSGTHPQVQVQMGLYGALVVGATAGAACTPRCAYDGVGYDHEVVVVYSETDPVLHAQVAADTYGDASAGAKTSTILYEPQYFFVDGEVDGPVGGVAATPNTVAFASLDAPFVGQSGDRVLLRLLNAGLETHSPFLQGARFTVVGEDGAPYPASTRSHQQYSVLLPAGKGLDALWAAGAAGTYPLLEHRRLTAHATPAAGTAAASGALLRLQVAAPPVPAAVPGAAP